MHFLISKILLLMFAKDDCIGCIRTDGTATGCNMPRCCIAKSIGVMPELMHKVGWLEVRVIKLHLRPEYPGEGR